MFSTSPNRSTFYFAVKSAPSLLNRGLFRSPVIIGKRKRKEKSFTHESLGRGGGGINFQTNKCRPVLTLSREGLGGVPPARKTHVFQKLMERPLGVAFATIPAPFAMGLPGFSGCDSGFFLKNAPDLPSKTLICVDWCSLNMFRARGNKSDCRSLEHPERQRQGIKLMLAYEPVRPLRCAEGRGASLSVLPRGSKDGLHGGGASALELPAAGRWVLPLLLPACRHLLKTGGWALY